jgi:hypothetical protein
VFEICWIVFTVLFSSKTDERWKPSLSSCLLLDLIDWNAVHIGARKAKKSCSDYDIADQPQAIIQQDIPHELLRCDHLSLFMRGNLVRCFDVHISTFRTLQSAFTPKSKLHSATLAGQMPSLATNDPFHSNVERIVALRRPVVWTHVRPSTTHFEGKFGRMDAGVFPRSGRHTAEVVRRKRTAQLNETHYTRYQPGKIAVFRRRTRYFPNFMSPFHPIYIFSSSHVPPFPLLRTFTQSEFSLHLSAHA